MSVTAATRLRNPDRITGALKAFAASVRRHAPLGIAYVALFVLVHAWFSPGLIAGEDFRYGWPDQAMLLHYFPWPESWDPAFGTGLNMDLWLPMYPLLFLAGGLAHLGLGWPAIERILWLFPLFVLLPFAPYVLAMRLVKSPWAASAGALLFAVNTWTVALTERGHFTSLIAYALLPLALLAAITAFRRNSSRAALWLGIILLVQIVYDIRYAYLSVIASVVLWIVDSLSHPQRRLSTATFRVALVAAGVLVFGSLYWLIPTLLSPVALPPGYDSLSEFIAASGRLSLLDAFAIFDPLYHHIASNDPFAFAPVEWPFVVIGFLTGFGMLVGSRRPLGRAIALVWLLSLVFLSGPSSLFGSLNRWLFVHVPGMSMFRDTTKLYALVCTTGSIGIAFFVSSIPELHSRMGRISKRVVCACASLLFLTFYLYAIRDAYNPLRLSNFSTVRLGAGDQKLARYIDDTAQDGRIVYFPDIPPGYRFGADHPSIAGGQLAMTYWPGGLASINESPTSALSFYTSPLAKPLLCELGVRYIVAVTDPTSTYYEPFAYPIQRGDTLRVFGSRPWLQEVDYGETHLPLAQQPQLYALRGCPQRSARIAFTAPYPVVFNGDPTYLAALNGTAFWTHDPAVAVAQEQRNLAPFDAIPNMVTAPVQLDSNHQTQYALPEAQERPLVEEGSRRALYQPWAYHGFAFSGFAQGPLIGQPGASGVIKQSFTTRSGKATLRAVITPRYGSLQEVATSYRLRPVSPATQSPPFLVNPDGFTAYAGEGTAAVTAPSSPDGWLRVQNGGGVFTVVNPLADPVQADITIAGAVALSGPDQIYDVSIGSVQSWGIALPNALQKYFNKSVSLTIRRVRLVPGSNVLTIRPANTDGNDAEPSSIAVYPTISIGNVQSLQGTTTHIPLPIITRIEPTGTRLRVGIPQNPNYASQARYQVLNNLNFPLGEQPQIDAQYLTPGSPVNLSIALGLSGPNGPVEYLENLPSGSHEYTLDAFVAVQNALDAKRERDRRAHQYDVDWLIKDANRAHDEASQYTLRYVNLLASAPPGNTGFTTDGVFRSASVSIPRTILAAPVVHTLSKADFADADVPAHIRTENVSIGRIQKTRDGLAILASLQRLSQEAIPSSIAVGDNATVTLTNGSVITGLVTLENPDLVVIKRGTSYVGVRRETIATIANLYPNERQAFSFVVPFTAPRSATNVTFGLVVDSALAVKPTLLVRDGASGAISEIFPQNRLDSAARKPEVPAAWMRTEPDVTRLAALDSDRPLPPSLPNSASAVRTVYDLPLRAIIASEMPQAVAPQLVGLRFSFDATNGDTSAAHDVAVQLSDLAATRATVGSVDGVNSLPTSGRLKLDGKDVGLVRRSSVAGPYGEAIVGQSTAVLATGRHEVSTSESRQTVTTALLSVGTPVPSQHVQIEAQPSNSYSEQWGSIESPGGLLVMPTTFSASWKLALVPSSFRPSGNVLIDFIRAHRYLVTPANQVRVNGGLNAWLIPAFKGNAVFLYARTFYSYVGALIEIAVILLACCLLWQRRSAKP